MAKRHRDKPLTKDVVTAGVVHWTEWWIEQRKRKFRQEVSETMSLNPLLAPIIYEMHNLSSIDELSEFLVGSHLMTGHNTGFGKLIDEKILPNIFGTTKLDKSYRHSTKPFQEARFDEIDHLLTTSQGDVELLSLKAGRWTIQLTMAVQLNAAFDDILNEYGDDFGRIVVGVYYGKKEELTDKYDIIRGINRGAHHDVKDITELVSVYAGSEFWSWLNGNETMTQEWVLEGIIKALKDENIRAECGKLLAQYKKNMGQTHSRYTSDSGGTDWKKLLKDISG